MKEATRYLTPERGRGSFLSLLPLCGDFLLPGARARTKTRIKDTRQNIDDDTEEDKKTSSRIGRGKTASRARKRGRERDGLYIFVPCRYSFFFAAMRVLQK